VAAFAEALEPKFNADLDRYFDQQRIRVKRELVG